MPLLPTLVPGHAGLLPAFGAGLALSATLIIAIGAQNAFVLRQGLRREHVGAVVLLCIVSEGLLITAGVAGVGALLQRLPGLEAALTLAGLVFLAAYGLRALARSRHPEALQAAAQAGPVGRAAVLAQAAAFTWLNPHVYLDTVLLLGSVGAQWPAAARPAFVAGAWAASTLWFGALGFAAMRLAPWFARPRSWQRLEQLIGLTMLALAAGLAWRLWHV